MSTEGGSGPRATAGPLGLTVAAGLMGAAGVALAAVAAHRLESPAIVTAANMMMIHAAAGLGLAAVAAQTRSQALLAAGAVLLAAVALFSGAVTYHAFTGNHIFPGAAPMGGSITILTWAAVAAIATVRLLRR